MQPVETVERLDPRLFLAQGFAVVAATPVAVHALGVGGDETTHAALALAGGFALIAAGIERDEVDRIRPTLVGVGYTLVGVAGALIAVSM